MQTRPLAASAFPAGSSGASIGHIPPDEQPVASGVSAGHTRLLRQWGIGLVALLVLATGCAQSGAQRSGGAEWQGDPRRGATLSVVEAQSAVMGLSDSLMFSVADACDRIIRRTSRSDARLLCATTRFGTGIGALSAATAPNVYVGFVDLITLAMLHRMWFEEPWASEMFDEDDRLLLHQTFAELEREVWDRAARVWTPQQQAELREMIQVWRAANPDRRELYSVRLLDFATARQVGQGGQVAGAPASIFSLLMIDPAASLSPATRELAESRLLAERLAFFGKRVPLVLGWQIELASARLLDSGVARGLLQDSSRIAEAVKGFSTSADRLATSYERTLDELPRERDAALAQVDRIVAERVEALIEQTAAAFASERAATIEHMGEELSESLASSIDRLSAQMDAQGEDTLERAAAIIAHERTQLSESLGSRLAEADARSQRLIDRIAIRLILVIVIGAMAVACIAFAYRRLDARFADPSRMPRQHAD